MENPFKYGVEVWGDDFVNRQRELRELRQELLSGKSILLITNRRFGKSSLIAEFFRRLGKEAVCLHLKLYEMDSEAALAGRIVEGISASIFGRPQRALRSITRFFKELRPTFSVSTDGTLTVSLSREITEPALAEALDFPERAAEEAGKRVILAFDEFQEIRLFNGQRLEKLMKSKFEEHRHASYIFAGSRRHLLLEMFSSEDRPLFRFAKPMELGEIPREEFLDFILEKFRKTGGKMREEVADWILEYTGGHPYFTQQLCHELWNLTRRVTSQSEVERAIDAIVCHHSIEYEQLWDMIRARGQRNLLRGMALDPGMNIFSGEFIQKYGMRSASHVKKACEALEGRGIVEDWPGGRKRIGDLFFSEWIRRRMGRTGTSVE
jgi:AAA+ ATPase superfamily predicted ATPase